jgi:hypothetical protein
MAVNNDLLLYIEPKTDPSVMPVIDALTCSMVHALRKAKEGSVNYWTEPPYTFEEGNGYKGWHRCSCGVTSSNKDYQLPGGEMTNSLAIHYLAYHRNEISEEQLKRVEALTEDTDLPTDEELKVPKGSEGYSTKAVIDSIYPPPDEDYSVGFKNRGMGRGDFCVMSRNGEVIAEIITNEKAEENANFIAKACNAYAKKEEK